MSTNFDTAAINGPCHCDGQFADPQLDVLRGLVTSGVGQWEASVRLWGPEANTIDRDVKAWVRAEFMRRFPWLQLEPA